MHFPGEPQVYPVCFQANLVSSSSGVPSETVRFPEAYDQYSQDYKAVDVWWAENPKNPDTFVPPGPQVASFGGSQPSTPTTALPSSGISSAYAQPTASVSASDVAVSISAAPSNIPAPSVTEEASNVGIPLPSSLVTGGLAAQPDASSAATTEPGAQPSSNGVASSTGTAMPGTTEAASGSQRPEGGRGGRCRGS